MVLSYKALNHGTTSEMVPGTIGNHGTTREVIPLDGNHSSVEKLCWYHNFHADWQLEGEVWICRKCRTNGQGAQHPYD